MEDVSSNVIDLRARIARLRAEAIAENAAAAAMELEGLRSTLRNLNIILQLHELSGNPLKDNARIHQTLDEVTEELRQCMHILSLPLEPM